MTAARLAIIAACASCGGSGGTSAPVVKHPKVDLAKRLPATLEAAHPKTGEPRQVHVRVWADTGVRALPHWKDEITDQIDYAGQLLTPMLGIRVTVDAIKEWDHAGSDVRDALKQLATVDDGAEVTWVIGYVTPGDVASKALMELGAGDVLGHYVTVRGWAEHPETEALAAKLPDLDAPQRAEVIAAHQRHKQAVVLLHMLGQTLGAIAEADPSWLEHPLYSPKQSTWSDRDRELIQLAIDQRLSGGTDQTIAHDLLEVIEKHEWGGWIPTDHDDVVKRLRNVVDAGKEGKTAADVPGSAYEQFDRVRELVKRNDLDQAKIELDNLLGAYPGNATMYELKCEIMILKPGVTDKTTRATCARAGELAPGDPSPHLAVGAALAAKDPVGARAELAQAGGKIANLPAGQTEAWKKLVAIYHAMGALTWTEEALAAAKLEGDPLVAELAQTRARFGVPRGTKAVKPEGEAALVAAVRAAKELVYAGKNDAAEIALAAGDKKWPGVAGFAAMRCDLELRRNRYDAARAACTRSLAADPDESWALYLSGVLALKDTSGAGTKLGVDKLKHAIAIDPDLGQAWRALGKAYDRAKDQAAHDELAKKYQAKFGQVLP